MTVQNNYTWEAETKDGEIISSGEDMSNCVRFSLVPSIPGLQRHDLIGVPMVRRFGRGFIRVLGDKPSEYLHCVVCEGFRMYIKSSDGSVLITPQDYEVHL